MVRKICTAIMRCDAMRSDGCVCVCNDRYKGMEGKVIPKKRGRKMAYNCVYRYNLRSPL
jgi:hypothetical protein